MNPDDPRATTGLSSRGEEIYRKYRNLILHILRSMDVPVDEHEDLLQDIFTRVYSHLHTLKDAGKLTAWVSSICRNACYDNRKKRRRQQNVSLQFEPPSEARGQAAALISAEQSEKLQQCLSELAPRSQQLIEQRFYQELPWKQVAIRQGLKIDAARKRTGKVLGTLRSCLRRKGYD